MESKRQFRANRSKFKMDGQIVGVYDLEETLGSGHFAVVKIARHVFSGERVAVKVMDKTKLDDVAREHLYQEIRCIKLVQHPNIVRLYEVIDTDTKVYLVLELGDGGDMYDYIMKHERGLSDEKARRYFRQIVEAIDYCHKLHIVHRDLKPENVIFFKRSDQAKLTDFGFSNKFSPGQMLETSCGSLAYSAPEILRGDRYDAPAVDVWSLGVILYMLLCGQAPFNEPNDNETLVMIMDCKYHMPDHLSEQAKLLIQRMLVRDPAQRATLESICSDPWLCQNEAFAVSSHLPTVHNVPLLAEEHLSVLCRMEHGNVGTREEIKKSLETNEYCPLTATYHLLAQQHIRRRLETTAALKAKKPISRRKVSPQPSGPMYLPELNVSPRQSDEEQEVSIATPSTSSPQEDRPKRLPPKEPPIMKPRSRTNSFSSDDEDLEFPFRDSVLLQQANFPSAESVISNASNTSSLYSMEEMPVPSVRQRNRLTKPKLSKAKSSPSLNEIYEERESDLEESPRNSPKLTSHVRPGHTGILKHKARKGNRRLSPILSSTGSRKNSSCSSSSEDEMEKNMRRLSASGCNTATRRRSRDDDDSSGEGGVGPFGERGGTRGSLKRRVLCPENGNCSNTSNSGNGNQSNGGKKQNDFIETSSARISNTSLSTQSLDSTSLHLQGDSISFVALNTALEKPIVDLNSSKNNLLIVDHELESLTKQEHHLNEKTVLQNKENIAFDCRNSIKYFHSSADEDNLPLRRGSDSTIHYKRDSLVSSDLGGIEMNMDMKLIEATMPSGQHFRTVVRSQTMGTVHSNCCHIV